MPDPYANETREQRDARMAWWREARFGMFIHWGVYAVPAGIYQGKEIPGIGEWIMLRGRIPVAEYKTYSSEFNPVQYDPAYWAKLAKKAGMRYIVITAKHHDGFALFPSDASDWDIADASPYGKDLIGPLADATRAEGLKFGLYYSQAQDWVHPGGAKFRPFNEGEGWDPAHEGNFDAYLDSIALPQVQEILTRYQPDILWWDTPQWMNQERAEKLIPALRLVPGIIHNNRLGGDYQGDTDTPEQHIPATGFKDRDWEVCMTMNDTWGYKSYDHHWKSTKDMLRKLCDIASKGGNFLLNIGPKPDGTIPQESIDRLEEIGAWMEVNGDSIYGTTASPFGRFLWGRSTVKLREDGATVYLHVFDWPQDGQLKVPGFGSPPESIQLIADQQDLTFRAYEDQHGKGITIQLPDQAPDPYVSVIQLQVRGKMDFQKTILKQSADGTLSLTPTWADLHSVMNSQLKVSTIDDADHIENWNREGAWVSWTFNVSQPGGFTISTEIAAEQAATLTYQLNDDDKKEVSIKATGSEETFSPVTLGTLNITEPGVYELKIHPVKGQWNPIRLRTITLIPEQ